MLTKTDIQNAQNGDYSSFFEAVKKTLEEKLENNYRNLIIWYKSKTK